MVRKIALGTIWLSFLGYTLWLNPLARPYTWKVLTRLLTLQWHEVNSYLVAIFCLMGVWPMIYACLMFADGPMQKFPAWPFFIGSNFLGLLALAPYFLLRQRSQKFEGRKDFWLSFLDRRSTGIGLTAITLGLVSYALSTGDWQDFVQQAKNYTFVHLITLDFILMGLAFPITTLFPDDMARRKTYSSKAFWAVALIPLWGPLLYLCCRSPLERSS
jgi:hypothetical protein